MKLFNLTNIDKLIVKQIRSLSQVFIVDKQKLGQIAEYSYKAKNIIEIGSGCGNLTKHFLKDQKKYLIELDQRFDERYFENIHNFFLKNGDALRIQEWEADINNYFNYEEYYIIGNLPYHVCNAIIKNCLYLRGWKKMFFLLEAELVQKILTTKKRCFLRNFINCFGTVEQKMFVDRNKFNPIPNVDSTLIEIKRHSNDIRQIKKEATKKKFICFIKKCFCYPRKTLLNNFKIYNKNHRQEHEIDLSKVSNLMKKIKIDEKTRSDKLTLSNFYYLFENLFIKND